ncbi:gamma-butyrobetaine dioxygenase [Echria macrotheca]|uniref:Gamma-butyrobetaine dioxygenase n=1 Tax=Echria macrotheca TaxID=438768 RepID=A0AAJ0FFV0_9PEZI|nr:gamma-butyrobetaine dioxygenase [Echria macrotheca]
MPKMRFSPAGLLGTRLVPRASTVQAGRRFLSHSVSKNVPSTRLRPIAVFAAPRRHLSTESPAKIQSVTTQDGAISLTFTDDDPLHLSTLWLRDSCACPHCVDPDSGQKTHSTASLPDKPAVRSAEVTTDGALQIVWESDVLSGGDAHTSVFSSSDIASWRADFNVRTPHLLPVQRTLWDNATYTSLLSSGHCRISYNDWLHNEPAFWAAFQKLCETGLIFVTDVPESETEVQTIANRIGILQYTFYGFTWDVRSKPRAENVAYTSQFLGLHQDLMYHVPIPRLQLLHCLANSCEGGESLFSDGVRAAYEMKAAQPDLYDVLTREMVPFHYKKGGHYYEMVRSTILEGEGGLVEGTHWAPPFQAPFKRETMVRDASGAVVSDPKDPHSLAKWRQAAAVFQSSIEAPENMVEVKLSPGECVVFDNWRLQHGRREFVTSHGHRWLKGTYITDQVHRGVENQLQRRNGAALPDLAEFRRQLANTELEQVVETVAARYGRTPIAASGN